MRHAIATALLAAVAVLLYWVIVWVSPGATGTEEFDTPAAMERSAPTRSPATVTPLGDAGVEPPPPPFELPRSLRGTQIDGGLTVDESGQFVPDALAIRLFDYLLSGEGEVSEAEIRAMLERIAGEQLPPNQVAKVMALFDDYLRYRREALRISKRYDADGYLRELIELQTKTFGAEDAERMFGRQNLLAEDTIARREIYADDSLSEAERASKLAELDAKLPASVRQTRQRLTQPARVRQVVEQMRADGLSEAEIDAYRADEFGDEAAVRLRALDEKRAAWQTRLDAYRKERDAIRARGLGEAATENAIQELREAHFEGSEVTRVRVHDQMEQAQR